MDMTRPLKVRVLFADTAGCGTYRCMLPAQMARSLGVDVRLIKEFATARIVEGRVTQVSPQDADVLVYQRPLRDILVDTIPMVQAQGVKVIVELDDDLENTHPQNGAYSGVSPRYSKSMNWSHLRRAVTMADMVTVSTDALKERYGGDKARVLPNFVPSSLLNVQRPAMKSRDGKPLDDQVRIGWAGQQAMHPLDLQVTSGAVAEVMERTGAAFRTIGSPDGVPQALGIRRGAFEATGWVPMEQYPNALSTIDVGLVPLDDTPFNRAKSWLKGLEMAAVGVPFIASPLPEYVKLHELGIGLLARSRTEWVDHLMRLVTDLGYRSDLAAQGKEAVRSVPLTMEGNGHRWVTAWTEVTRHLIVPGRNGARGASRTA